MNVFSGQKIYAAKWVEINCRNFEEEEIAAVLSNKVVESQYGLSVCFFMQGGGSVYIPLDENSSKSVGDVIDLTQAKIVTLARPGDRNINRIRA